MGVLTILNAVTRDAVTFFLSVSATHLLVVIMYVAARVGIFPRKRVRVRRVLTDRPVLS